jgi:hypothetical protein
MSFLQHTWSLGIEEQLYTLWPLCLRLLLRARNGRLTSIAVVCAGIAGSAVLRPIRWQGRETLLRDYYSPLLHLVHSPSRGMEAVLTVPALVWLGRISSGVYLWQSDPAWRARGGAHAAARLHRSAEDRDAVCGDDRGCRGVVLLAGAADSQSEYQAKTTGRCHANVAPGSD